MNGATAQSRGAQSRDDPTDRYTGSSSSPRSSDRPGFYEIKFPAKLS